MEGKKEEGRGGSRGKRREERKGLGSREADQSKRRTAKLGSSSTSSLPLSSEKSISSRFVNSSNFHHFVS